MSGISGGFSSGGERGLLGLAFHPSFETNRRLYVYYTRGDGDIMVAEFLANASRTSASINRFILRVEHSSAGNHNGGQLLFGPDGFLYIFTGDGGGGGDPGENAQDRNELLGKVLRVSVNTGGQGEFGNYSVPSDNPYFGSTAGRDEIYDIGMRNPWRASFDRASNDLWIADVGQGSYEEINRRRWGRPRVSTGAGIAARGNIGSRRPAVTRPHPLPTPIPSPSTGTEGAIARSPAATCTAAPSNGTL